MRMTAFRFGLLAGLLCMVFGPSGCRRQRSRPPAPTTRAASSPVQSSAGRPGAGAEMPRTLPRAQTKAIDGEHLAKVQRMINRGLGFLLSARNDDGGWGFEPGKSHPALTAMAIKAFLQHPDYDIDSPVVRRAFACLMKFRQDDGGFYIPEEGNANYVTSVAVMALATARDPRQKQVLADAIKFLRRRQIVPGSRTPDGELITEDHPYVGGVSYGKHGRPDLSNVGMWMDAMHEAGVSGDDPAMQRALAFVKRLQNRTEGTAGQSFVVKGEDDGGFIYAVRRKGSTFVGESKAGSGRRGLRSYGSMTYVGFKSMLYANVARDDPRVQAAYEWIRKYWRLDSNPNMPEAQSRQGLFYYYHVFAKALRAWGQDIIPDARGVKHNWRHELIDVLHSQQRPDGSWVNTASRWMEANPVLVTCYSLLALEEALKG